MRDLLDRIQKSQMAFYRHAYRNSKRWKGKDSLQDKRVIVYGEQGNGDIIHFARYFKSLKDLGCHTIIHAPVSLHKLFLNCCEGVDEVFDKEDSNLPPHDYHVLSLSLPFLLDNPTVKYPYIHIKEKETLEGSKKKIGIAWEGNPKHANNYQRSCPLVYFKNLRIDADFYSLQKDIHLPYLTDGCEDFELWRTEMNDYYETAKLINSLDMVVAVDTSVLHLAGAMGKKSIGLLSKQHDKRWDMTRNWYPSIRMMKQIQDDDWSTVFKDLELSLISGKNITYYADRKKKGVVESIVLTGGIGDIFTLESYFTDELRANLKTIYVASRNFKPIETSLKAVYPHVQIISIWDDFKNRFAFYTKAEVWHALVLDGKLPPSDWNEVEDWSILPQFDVFQYKKHNGSSFVNKKLADISGFKLPDNYAVVVHTSPSDKRDEKRDFNEDDWNNVRKLLKQHEFYGVVLVNGQNEVPNYPELIDLTNKTSILESLEIVKGAKAYWGIDSCLAVIAARIFRQPMLKVKSTNFDHLYRWKHVYYNTHRRFAWLKDSI